MKLKQKIKDNYLFKLAIIIGVIILLDVGIGFILRKVYFSQIQGVDYRTTYVMEENTSDVLVLGASSGNHHYHPEEFRELGYSFYNGGCDGNFIFYYYALLKATLERYTPKLVILDLGDEDFYESPTTYDRITTLLPYYRTHPEIREIVHMKSRWERIKLLSNIYPFNSKAISSLTGWLDLNKKKERETMRKGYVPLNNTWNRPPVDQVDDRPIDTVKVNLVRRFIDDCQANDVDLILVTSPSYRNIDRKMKYVTLLEEIAAEEDVPFWDYSTDTYFTENPGYFFDYMHLNDEGARVFSGMIVDRIDSLYKVASP